MMWSFKRYEFKSLLHAEDRDRIRDELLERMKPDPHAKDGSYRLTSLYYDTPDLRCFHSMVDGIKYRHKLRIRVYGDAGDDANGPAMVEIKQRIGRTIQKRRVLLPLAKAKQLCRGQQPCIWPEKRDAGVAAEVESLVRSLSLAPSCVVSYLRHAYVGDEEDLDLRITFDQLLTCRRPEEGMAIEPEGRAFIPRDWVVMEVKVNHAIPLWINQLMARHECKFHRLSKYRLAVAHLAAAERGLRCG